MTHLLSALVACMALIGVSMTSTAAMMPAGWTDDAPHRNAPGFPDNGRWSIRWEGLSPAL